MTSSTGSIYLVGGGPGDPGLITVRGLALLRQADVVVHDRLSSRELLSEVPRHAEVINIADLAPKHRERQVLVNQLLVDRARQGLRVVRLKGGDPFVFGRGYEEWQLCREAGVMCAVVPGVSSAIAAPLAAGIPVTSRKLVRSLAVMTAAVAGDSEAPPLDYRALARIDTIIVMMGRRHLAEVCRELRAVGLDEDTAVACVESATTPQQRVTKGTLATIVDAVDQNRVDAPMTVVIGSAAGLAQRDASPTMPGWSRESSHATALTGKRILVTRPKSCCQKLADALLAAGATPIAWPVTRIVYSHDTLELDKAIQQMPRFDWIVFTSKSGVHGFWRGLIKAGLDARALSFCRIGATGKSTIKSLERIGLVPDVSCYEGDQLELAASVIRYSERPPGRVLHPRGDQTGRVLSETMSRAGGVVDAPIVYEAVAAGLPAGWADVITTGIDAVVLYSASAVQHCLELDLNIDGAAIVCVGEASRQAMRNAGRSVDVFVEHSSNDDLVNGLIGHFE